MIREFRDLVETAGQVWGPGGYNLLFLNLWVFHTDHMLLGSNKWEYAYYLLFNNMHGTEQYRKNEFPQILFHLFYFLFSEEKPNGSLH